MLFQHGIEHQYGPASDVEMTTLEVFAFDSDDSVWDAPIANTGTNYDYTKINDLAHEADEVITDDEAISNYSSDSEMESSDDENLTYQPQPPSYGTA